MIVEQVFIDCYSRLIAERMGAGMANAQGIADLAFDQALFAAKHVAEHIEKLNDVINRVDEDDGNEGIP